MSAPCTHRVAHVEQAKAAGRACPWSLCSCAVSGIRALFGICTSAALRQAARYSQNAQAGFQIIGLIATLFVILSKIFCKT